MNATTIHRLIDSLPPEEVADLGANYHMGGGNSPFELGVAKFVVLYKDMGIGWKLARKFARLGLPLPALEGADNWLWRAYLTQCDPLTYQDEVIHRTVALTKAPMALQRDTIEAFLVTQGASISSVVEETNEPPEVIEAYEKLFFNVLDRMQDHLYVQHIIYPESRMVEMYEDYIQNAGIGPMLKRIGFNGSAMDIRHFSGIRPSALAAMATSDSSANFEAAVMTNGYILAKNGFLNQRANAQGIHVAKGILAASKAGGEDATVQSDFLDMGPQLMAEMSRLKITQAGDRLQSIQENIQDAVLVEPG